jgi:hypothetical protein
MALQRGNALRVVATRAAATQGITRLITRFVAPAGLTPQRRCIAPRAAKKNRRQFFLLLGLWPAGVLPVANGLTGAPLPFLRFLSAFGFFFSLLLRI